LAVAAVALAMAAGEAALRTVHLRPTEWPVPDEEPQRQPDAQLGWVLAPDRVGRAVVGGRTIDYAIDHHGYACDVTENRSMSSVRSSSLRASR